MSEHRSRPSFIQGFKLQGAVQALISAEQWLDVETAEAVSVQASYEPDLLALLEALVGELGMIVASAKEQRR